MSHYIRYYCQQDILPIAYIHELNKQILSVSSRYMFASTAFAIAFKRSGFDELKNNFPFLNFYLNHVLKTSCNCFFINALILKQGKEICFHRDYTLSQYTMELTVPNLVSVLYVQIPLDIEGGELLLKLNQNRRVQIKPQENMLIHFRGTLEHSVNQVEKISKPRISLICEQYNLPENKTKKIPNFQIVSEREYLSFIDFDVLNPNSDTG